MKSQFTEKQKLAYMLTKNFVFDSVSNLKSYLQFEEGEIISSSIEKEMQDIADAGIRMIFYGESGYPESLTGLNDSPLMLFIKSKTAPEELFDKSASSFKAAVGTRDIDDYGSRMTKSLISKYSTANPGTVIVSGLDIGVDKLAHITALECGLRTIAVLPTELDSVYPHCHKELAERIAETPGCALVSPFAPGTAPETVNFILRNRVIAALSDTTIVLQSKIKGGAMMTAKQAYDLDKEVYAVPGRADDVRSEGCNRLIADEIANLLML